jgi:hypothetical protein
LLSETLLQKARFHIPDYKSLRLKRLIMVDTSGGRFVAF